MALNQTQPGSFGGGAGPAAPRFSANEGGRLAKPSFSSMADNNDTPPPMVIAVPGMPARTRARLALNRNPYPTPGGSARSGGRQADYPIG